MSVKSVLTALADAIRSKSGLTGPMTLEQMTEAVRGIQQGIDTSDATASGGIQAQHITSENDTITISGSGTVKVWGYGYNGYTGTTYSFVGDGYYSGGYGTPSKTSSTFSISNGKLIGLPSDLTSLDVLVTIGI